VGKFWNNIRHDARIWWLNWRAQYRASVALRGAFALQVFGMIINNLGLTFAWIFLFDRFGTLNGWGAADFIGMQGASMFIFGTMLIFNAGLPELARFVDNGTFDTFLTKPVSVLMQLASSRIEIAALGDILLGLVLMIGYGIYAQVSLGAVALFLVAVAIGVVIIWCFTLLPYILAFYLFDSDKVSRAIAFFFLDTGIFPTGVITGKLRILLLTVWPGLFIAALPLDVLRGLHWEWVALGAVVAGTWLAISLWLFRKSLRRYESANLVGAR